MAVQGSIKYTDLNSNIIEEISMPLLDHIMFKAAVNINDVKSPTLRLSMQDVVTSNVELEGEIDMEKLQVLIKNLNIIYRQLLTVKQLTDLEGGEQ